MPTIVRTGMTMAPAVCHTLNIKPNMSVSSLTKFAAILGDRCSITDKQPVMTSSVKPDTRKIRQS